MNSPKNSEPTVDLIQTLMHLLHMMKPNLKYIFLLSAN